MLTPYNPNRSGVLTRSESRALQNFDNGKSSTLGQQIVTKLAKEAGKAAIRQVKAATNLHNRKGKRKVRPAIIQAQPEYPIAIKPMTSSNRAPMLDSRKYRRLAGYRRDHESGAHYWHGRQAGSMMMAHREEFLNLVTGPVDAGFNIHPAIQINPLNQELFTWLPKIASGFQHYKFRKLSVIYNTATSYFANGIVRIVADSDASDGQLPQNGVEMSNYDGAIRGSVYASEIRYNVPTEMLNSRTVYTVHPGNDPSVDEQICHVGNLFIAHEFCNNGLAAGTFSIEYEIELELPQMHNLHNTVGRSALIEQPVGATVPFTADVLTGATVVLANTYNGITLDKTTTNGTIRFNTNNVGSRFMVVTEAYSGAGTPLTTSGSTTPSLTGLVPVNDTRYPKVGSWTLGGSSAYLTNINIYEVTGSANASMTDCFNYIDPGAGSDIASFNIAVLSLPPLSVAYANFRNNVSYLSDQLKTLQIQLKEMEKSKRKERASQASLVVIDEDEEYISIKK